MRIQYMFLEYRHDAVPLQYTVLRTELLGVITLHAPSTKPLFVCHTWKCVKETFLFEICLNQLDFSMFTRTTKHKSRNILKYCLNSTFQCLLTQHNTNQVTF